MKGTNLIKQMSRRRVLRGMLGSCAVTVGLPLLDCFLDSNATALASGDPMPVRFGTWFWGLGMDEKVFVPKTLGANYELPEEIAALAPVRDHVNLFTNFNAFRDASPNLCHYTGWVISRTGVAPASNDDRPGETIDVTHRAQDQPQHALPEPDGHGHRGRPQQLQLRGRQHTQLR
jgi:hypothetical protein